jgi:hypothetical protein
VFGSDAGNYGLEIERNSDLRGTLASVDRSDHRPQFVRSCSVQRRDQAEQPCD